MGILKTMRELRELAIEVGFDDAEVTVTGGHHLRIRVTYAGQSRNVFASMTASDWRARRRVKTDLRHELQRLRGERP